jgi:hypothetical protein
MKSSFLKTLVTFGMLLLLVPPGVLAQTVDVDIKPGSCENPLNIKSKGVLPVVILGTDTFDVSLIDPASIRLVIDSVGIAPFRSKINDVATPPASPSTCLDTCTDTETAPDGFPDLILKFRTQQIVTALGGWDVLTDGQCVILDLAGVLADSSAIDGQDVVTILKKGKKPPKPPKK